jgi:hypothetical protein
MGRGLSVVSRSAPRMRKVSGPHLRRPQAADHDSPDRARLCAPVEESQRGTLQGHLLYADPGGEDAPPNRICAYTGITSPKNKNPTSFSAGVPPLRAAPLSKRTVRASEARRVAPAPAPRLFALLALVSDAGPYQANVFQTVHQTRRARARAPHRQP